MSKPRTGIVFILILLATSLTFAQSFFAQPNTTSSNQNTATTTPKPLSPEDFNKLVKQQTQQTQAQINQQVTQKIPSKPTYPAPSATQPPAATMPSTPSAPEQPTDTTTTANTQPQPDANPAPETGSTTTQEYTGFSTEKPNSNSGTSTKKPSGLGIQY